MQRDLYDLNLMQYYNCYAGQDLNIRIKEDENPSNYSFETANNDGLISYLVPIKFNKDYTIYYNSHIPFKIVPIYYDGIKYSKYPGNTGITKVNSCSMNNPYLYNKITYEYENIETIAPSILKEKYLHLLIQVPKSDKTSLLVLEGNYKNIRLNITDNSLYRLPKLYHGDVNSLNITDVDNILKSVPELSFKRLGTNYAFSDRLLEYLLYAPIINEDRIRDNILRVQNHLSCKDAQDVFGQRYNYPYKKDIWDTNLRYYIYDIVTNNLYNENNGNIIYTNKNPLFLDINGYVDKDSEFIVDKTKLEKDSMYV